MTTPAQDPQQGQPQAPTSSRTAEFSSGQSGSGIGTHIASSIPQPVPAAAAFNPEGSILQAANHWSGVNNGTSSSTLSVSDPYGKAMAQTLKSSGTGEAAEQ